MSNKEVGFKKIWDEYPPYLDFGIIFTNFLDIHNRHHAKFLLQHGYLFKEIKLCIPCTSLKEFLV